MAHVDFDFIGFAVYKVLCLLVRNGLGLDVLGLAYPFGLDGKREGGVLAS
ncbi:MAG: hypothetical protein ACMG6E_04400 [Candidatus Roizmanbacteria bacterium]